MKESDCSEKEARWAAFDVCISHGKYEEAIRILEHSPEMRENKDCLSPEAAEKGYQKLMERLKDRMSE